ncbi:MAG: hypothetical protein AAGB23_02815 [Pseudomonadota bacterium]
MIDAPPPEHSSYEERLSEELAGCGLARSGIMVRYVEEHFYTEVDIRKSAGATIQHFECIRAVVQYDRPVFEEPELNEQWADFSYRIMSPEIEASARELLEKRGLVEGLPNIQNSGGYAGFLPALEEHCGLVAGSTLELLGSDTVTLKPSTDANLEDVKKFSCLLAGLKLAGVRKFGFTGIERSAVVDE